MKDKVLTANISSANLLPLFKRIPILQIIESANISHLHIFYTYDQFLIIYILQ